MYIKNIIKGNEHLYNVVKATLDKKRYLEIKYNYISMLKRHFKKRLGYDLNLDNPQTFNEKIQWIKVYYHNPLYTTCADKYKVRDYVQEKIGKKYLNDIYGFYESVDEIDLDQLPKKFVLKPSHSSGHVIICTDKSKVDWNKEFKKMKKWIKENFFYKNGEWQYKDIKPRIICEKLLDSNINDYKFFCFNGEPKFIQVDYDRYIEHKRRIYDINWIKADFSLMHEDDNREIPKPINFDLMLELSRILSKEFHFVRVDFYEVESKLYLGELTFTPGNGMEFFRPIEWDKKLGDYFILPNV